MEERHPPDDAEGRAAPSRRDLLDAALAAGSVVWAVGVAVPTAMYVWPAGSGGPAKTVLELDPGSVPVGTGRVVRAGEKPVLVLHLPGGEFRALSAVCTHLGCIVHWDALQGRILCPCHGAAFVPDGSVASGPPPRPLAVYPCRVVDGTLRIET